MIPDPRGCPACGAAGPRAPVEEHFDRVGGRPYRLFLCRACGVVFSEPREAVGADWYARAAPLRGRERRGGADRDFRFRLFLEEGLPPGRLLDVGCGDGGFLRLAAARGFSPTGFDYDARVAQAARRAGLDAHALEFSAFCASRADREFDAITLFDVLEHTPEPARFLLELKRLLRPGGHIAVTLPNALRPLPWGREEHDYPPHHFTRWTPQALRGFLESHGFAVLRQEHARLRPGYLADNFFFRVLMPGLLRLSRLLLFGGAAAAGTATLSELYAASPAPAAAPGWRGRLRSILADKGRRQSWVDALRALCSPVCLAVGAALALFYRASRPGCGDHLYTLARLGPPRLRPRGSETAARLAALGLALATGLWGLGWGLPGPGRLRALPPELRGDPGFALKLAESWQKLYREIWRSHRERLPEEPVTYARGVEEFPPGWSFPPGGLVNAVRATLLQSENPDEKKSFIILSQMRPWKLELQPLYAQYGGAFIYPLGAFLKAASWAGAARLVPDVRHYLLHPEGMARVYLLGRLFVLIAHLGSVCLLLGLGRRVGGRGAGPCAALFFCLSPLVVVNAHILKPHPYAAFWCLAALRWALEARETGFPRAYLLGGLCAGMAAGSSLAVFCFAGAAPLAWLARRAAGSAGPREWRPALAAAAAAALVCLLANPYLLLRHGDFVLELGYARGGRPWSGLLGALRGVARDGLGPALFLAAAVGAVAAWRAGGSRRFFCVLSAACGLALWASLQCFWSGFAATPRFYYPCIAPACLLAGAWVAGLRPAWRAAALAAALLGAGPQAWVYLENMRLDSGPRSTRLEAARWIEARVPAGAAIGLARYPEPAHTPPFRYDLYRLLVFQDPRALPDARLPEYLVVDAEGRPGVEAWAGRRYALERAFEPARLGWARPRDAGFYANEGMFLYRLRP